MRLLLFTQTVDTEDPVLGFFHRWLEVFSKRYEHIHVICLKEGKHELPLNVSVHSLGKEGGVNVFKYVTRFYRYLFTLRGQYDRVFVHMNPHYVLLGGIIWKLSGTPIFFWRNHKEMNMKTRVAARFATRVMYTSRFACMSRYAHSIQMPVGIDVERFTLGERTRDTYTKILSLGRLSPIKRPELCIDAGTFLPEEFEIHLYGDDPTPGKQYYKVLKERAGKRITFHPAVTNAETPVIYHAYDIFINLTPEGSMDKTVLEATACGTLVIVVNTSFSQDVPERSILTDVTPEGLAQKILEFKNLPEAERVRMHEMARSAVVEHHSLEKLSELLYNYMAE